MYASVTDMVARFGEVQILRLSNPEDRDATTIVDAKVNTALNDATVLIDGYIRGRYLVPIAVPPADIVRATCTLALHDLAQGDRTTPSEEMEKNRKATITWLENIAKEMINLDAPAAVAPNSNSGSGARVSDRASIMSYENLRGM